MHDARRLWGAPGARSEGRRVRRTASGVSALSTAKQPIARFPAAEGDDPLPRLRQCPPRRSRRRPSWCGEPREPASDPARDAWGAAWPRAGARRRVRASGSGAGANASSRSARAPRRRRRRGGRRGVRVSARAAGGSIRRGGCRAERGRFGGRPREPRCTWRGGGSRRRAASGAAEIHLAGRLCDRRASARSTAGLWPRPQRRGVRRRERPAEDHRGAEGDPAAKVFRVPPRGRARAHAAKITCAATDAGARRWRWGTPPARSRRRPPRGAPEVSHETRVRPPGRGPPAEGRRRRAFCPRGRNRRRRRGGGGGGRRERTGPGPPRGGGGECGDEKAKRGRRRGTSARRRSRSRVKGRPGVHRRRRNAPVGKPCHPETPSRARSRSRRRSVGAPRRTSARKMTKTKTKTPLGEPGAEENWLGEEDESDQSSGEEDDQVVSGSTYHTPRGFSRTALVAVASAEALRVYPANGAAKGERHTVKKATPGAPRVAALGSRPLGRRPARPVLFAAVTARGRLPTFALPSLAPLAAIGPLPPLARRTGGLLRGRSPSPPRVRRVPRRVRAVPRPAGPGTPGIGATLHDDEPPRRRSGRGGGAGDGRRRGGGAAGRGGASSFRPRRPGNHPGSSSRPVAKTGRRRHALRGARDRRWRVSGR